MFSSITFHGGAGEVTGSNFLLDTGSAKILIDCGSREGIDADLSVPAPLPYNSREITALLVTHAHQDHIGRIPELVRAGFTGPIYSTSATKDLAAIMFDDAFGILERDAHSHGASLPYERSDIERALSMWQVRDYHEPFALSDVAVEMRDAGHILGAAMIKLTREDRSVLFTGDIGNSPEPLLNDPESPAGVTYLVMESVYGDRLHNEQQDRKKHLQNEIEDARRRGGTLLIPSFSIERTQVLLSEIGDLIDDGMLPLSVYLDAPLAERVTEVFKRHTALLNSATREKIAHGRDPFNFSGLTVIDTTRESALIEQMTGPKVIIAGAGMSVGGRVRRHERALLGERNTTMLFIGYQAPGTLGRRLQEGAKKVEIDGEWVRVRALIATLSGYSGHADRDQLLDFLEQAAPTLDRAFMALGEARASLFLAQRARDFLGVDAYVPQKGERAELTL